MFRRLLILLGGALLLTSCIPTQKTVAREAALNDWLTDAEKPVQVINQRFEARCAPGYNCYTLIDKAGRTYYAQNVRMELPATIP
jgi:hypothetical protein